MSLQSLLQEKPLESVKVRDIKNCLDPRSDDYPEDSRLWELILKASQNENMTLFSGLLFIRQQGCHINEIDGNRYKIEPIIGIENGWKTMKEYTDFRDELLKMGLMPEIKRLLDCLYQATHRKVSE